MQKRSLIPVLVGKVLAMYGAQLTPLNVTGFLASLPTSKPDETQETTTDQAKDVSQSTQGTAPVHIPS